MVVVKLLECGDGSGEAVLTECGDGTGEAVRVW